MFKVKNKDTRTTSMVSKDFFDVCGKLFKDIAKLRGSFLLCYVILELGNIRPTINTPTQQPSCKPPPERIFTNTRVSRKFYKKFRSSTQNLAKETWHIHYFTDRSKCSGPYSQEELVIMLLEFKTICRRETWTSEITKQVKLII